ncbi:MAG: hypothetical protein MJY52_01950 [Bacteroidaceae bacterium]|nr:hypothetical protein [Bacteroidaceae bacterium]
MDALLFQPKSKAQYNLLIDLAKQMKVKCLPLSFPKKSSKCKTGLELAWEDVDAGRITTYSSSEEMFDKLGI